MTPGRGQAWKLHFAISTSTRPAATTEWMIFCQVCWRTFHVQVRCEVQQLLPTNRQLIGLVNTSAFSGPIRRHEFRFARNSGGNPYKSSYAFGSGLRSNRYHSDRGIQAIRTVSIETNPPSTASTEDVRARTSLRFATPAEFFPSSGFSIPLNTP